MKKIMIMAAMLTMSTLTTKTAPAQAQSIAGKYVDAKSQATYEIDPAGNGYTVTQLSTPTPKDQANNGKVMANITTVSGDHMTGTVASGEKQYQTTWDVADDGTITMKVKAGMFHYTATWKRQ